MPFARETTSVDGGCERHWGRMRNHLKKGALALLVSVGLMSCGSDPTNGATTTTIPEANKITGNVHEWGIDISAQRAKTGIVTFAIANFGTIPHEFIVVKTDFKSGDIPIGKNNRINEDGDGVEAINEIAEFEVDTSHILKVMLAPGSYQLLCNIAGHYKNGMHVDFTVS